MNEKYVYSNNRLFVQDSFGLTERKDFPTIEQLKLENELETLKKLLQERYKQLDNHKKCKKPKQFLKKVLINNFQIIGTTIFLGLLLFSPFSMSPEELSDFIRLLSIPIITSVSYATIILGLIYHKENKSYITKCELEEEIRYLEAEIKVKTEELETKSKESRPILDTPIISLEDYNRQFLANSKNRLERIKLLVSLRDELIKCQSNEKIAALLASKGLSEIEISESQEYIAKHMTLKPVHFR